MASAALAGSTGLVGGHILTQLLEHPSISAVHAYTRRELPNPTSSTKLHPLSSTDTATWASLFPRSPAPSVFFSGLGTTRAAAGSLENQRKIDYDLNLELAKTAKEAGVDTYVLISSASANGQSSMGYVKMKGELEDRVKELKFKHTVIVRPGLIVGERTESRFAEAVARSIAVGLGKLNAGLKDAWAQDADVIARAAVVAGLQCAEGKREEDGVWMLGQGDIISLGKAIKE
ncbi:hypothetical protein K504DRAFT_461922 [Pleomassaria siparia CBS 279.74]|uniref:NAD dependent epimerase/dehydratase family protein-like protein n=1 Tax=Pleomassaria siparia CBS 279.74 TaxID=1314801 RepID=A0A6G1KKR7_9PLEO|nr:hypothetical protein K504DRAFT_461922 [Pleomassaria siparia CBS 279.74]